MAEIVVCLYGEWLRDSPSTVDDSADADIYRGSARTGTTLADRILSSHSQVQSAGESQLFQMVLRDGTRAGNQVGITKDQIGRAANEIRLDSDRISRRAATSSR